ncbi:MAG: HAD hydrolase-like protein [Cyanobacteria bacterium P01_C01_bin.120]
MTQPTSALSPLQSGSVVFCDFDGPIVDVSDRYYQTYCLALAAIQKKYAEYVALPVRRLTKAQFWYMKQNRVPDVTIADWSGLSGQQIKDFLAHVQALVNQSALLHLDRLQPGAKAALNELQARGIRLVLVTLRQAGQVLDFLHQHDLATAISQIYGADDVETAYANCIDHKVARLREAIAEQRQLGFDTTASCMIGDTEADVRAGQVAELPTVALTCGIRSALYLNDFAPTAVYANLQTALPDLICRSASLRAA